MSQDQQPIYILNNNIESTNGRSAQRSNIAAAKAVAEAVRSTLGPSGSDKMLVSGEGKEVVITNDGATILRQIDCQHPAGNLMISVAENQEEAAYDGTTSSVIIAGSLLSEAELLIQKGIHPTTICKGFREASKVALAQLKEQIKYIAGTIDPSNVNSMLDPVAKTSLTGKSAESEVDLIAQLAIEAVSKAANETSVTLDDIKIVTFAGANFSDSELLEGCLIEKDPAHTQMPPAIRGKILCLTSDLEVKEMKQDSTLSISDPDALEAFLAKEEDALKEMVNKIKESGASIVLVKGAIDDLAKHFLSRERILAVERVTPSDLELIRKTTGANLVNSLKDLKTEDLGEGSARVIQYGEHHCVHVYADNQGPVTAVLRGVSSHTAEELERAFQDCIGVVSVAYEDGEYLAGGGASYAHLSRSLKKHADKIGGREQMAIDSFAAALEAIPRTLAENAGVDPVDAMIELRKQVAGSAFPIHGVSMDGSITDMLELQVLEPSRVVTNAIKSATEAAISILRIDDVLSMGIKSPGMPGGM